jgi:hypothetical protein
MTGYTKLLRTPSIATIVRRLHAAELDNLREIAERQHAGITMSGALVALSGWPPERSA